MFKVFVASLCLLMLIIPACQTDEDCCLLDTKGLSDTWILFEQGYSPGDRYITEPVSDTPPQTMDFSENGRFSSNISGLEQFAYFRILQDDNTEILALFEMEPNKSDENIDTLSHSYIIDFQDNGTVKLYFRFCFEGCHLGLRKHSDN